MTFLSCISKYFHPGQSDCKIDIDSNEVTHTHTGRIWTKRFVNGSLFLLAISSVVVFILLTTHVIPISQYSIALRYTFCCLTAAAGLVFFMLAIDYSYHLLLARSDRCLEETDVQALD